MTIQFAPNELLHEIFQYLPRSSLLSCSTVCKPWTATAIQLFYENVELSEKTKAIWLHIVHQTQEGKASTSNVGLFVKRLTVSLAFSTTMTQQEFLEVLSYLPFVRAIDLDLSGYKLHFLAYLNKRSTGCVTHLEEIHTGDLFTNFQMQQYFLCAYSFRHSLKRLTLKNPNATYTIDGQSASAISFLNKFENLSHVTVISNSDTRIGELATVLLKLQSCTKVLSLLYQNDNVSLEEEADFGPMLMDTTVTKSKSKYTIPTIIHSKLQNIELHIPTLTEQYIKTILYHFPSRLNTFTISMTDADYRGWIEEHNKLFGLYLAYVKNLKISISNQSRRRPSIGGPIPTVNSFSSLEGLSKHWSFIQSTVGDSQVFCQMRVTFAKLGTKPDFTIERDQRNLIVTYNLENVQDFGRCLEEFSPYYSAVQQSSSISGKALKLNSLVVEVPATQDDAINSKKYLEIFESVLSRSRLPQSIVIKSSESSSSDGYWMQLGSTTPPAMPQFYPHADNFSPDDFPTLKYALLKNVNSITQPLKTLSDMLPNVKILKIINCKLTQDALLPKNYTIDVGNFDYLNLLVLDLAFLDSDQRRQALIIVEMENGQDLFFTLDASGLLPGKTESPLADKVADTAFSVVTIKCRKLDQIMVVLGKEDNILVNFGSLSAAV